VNLKNIFRIFAYTTAALLLISTAHAGDTATIHGAVYEWYTFEPLENVIIEVNSTPPQSIVARYGVYSFNLAPGNYLITARYYQNNTLTSSADETITITENGDYVLDLLLFPAYDEEFLNETEFSEITETFDEESKIIEEDTGSGMLYLVVVISIFVIAVFAVYTIKTKSREKEYLAEEAAPAPPEEEIGETVLTENISPLPSNLQEVLDIIIAGGGRITQKELRSRLKYSEAKVSLMVSDLENRGWIEKFKKGRGNIIRTVDK